MKTFSISLLFSLFLFSVYAATHEIGVNSNNFSPSSITTVQVGDIIRWTLNGGSHTTTSTSVPSGAATWNHTFSGAGDTFEYTVTVAGNYTYECSFHGGMTGSFTASTLSIDNQESIAVSVFPVPFSDFIVVNHPPRTTLELVNVYGKTILSQNNPSQEVSGFDTYTLDGGIYFLIFKSDKGAIEIRKILKVE
ncbi:MAG: T9SS type A sorting domain-containing protein [Bacteroidia bacterium]